MLTPFDIPMWIMLIVLFVMGSVVGSFLNVCIYRIPKHDTLWLQLKGLSHPPSSCPKCGHRISSFDNVPIFGWLKLLGRCRNCRVRISARYPLIELFNGLLFAAVYWYEIPGDWNAGIEDSPFFSAQFFRATGLDPNTMSHTSVVSALHWKYLYHMVLFESLIVATFIDFDCMLIPDACTLPAMLVGVVGAGFSGRLHVVPLWFQDASLMRAMRIEFPEWLHFLFPSHQFPEWIAHWPHLHGLAVSLAGLIAGGGIVWGVRLIGAWVLRDEAMGFGDVILMAMIGSFIGWQSVLVVFFLAALLALALVLSLWLFRRRRVIPYGPYLSMATLVVLLGWEHVWPAVARMFDLGSLLPVLIIVGGVFLAGALFLVQAVKWALGIQLYREDWIEEWTSADQIMQYAGRKVDERRGSWRIEQWEGTSAGRGTLYDHRWRGQDTDR